MTECQSKRWRLDARDGDEEREKEWEGGMRSLALLCSVLVCEGLATWRCWLPVVVVVAVGDSLAVGPSVIVSSSLLPASSLLLFVSSSSLLMLSVVSSMAASPGPGVASSVPLAV